MIWVTYVQTFQQIGILCFGYRVARARAIALSSSHFATPLAYLQIHVLHQKTDSIFTYFIPPFN